MERSEKILREIEQLFVENNWQLSKEQLREIRHILRTNVKVYVALTEDQLGTLREGDYMEVESIVEDILEQVKGGEGKR